MSPTAVTKPVLPPLQTPKTASFPSEICSTPISAACVSAVIKQEADLKTPITPPTAYTDFLKALTPVLASPPPTALPRNPSDDSIVSAHSAVSTTSTFSSRSAPEHHRSPTSATIPPTPTSAKSRPASAGLRRLRIPQHSPLFSPGSAVGPSPRTSVSGLSASTLGTVYSPFSPADWSATSRHYDTITTPRSACSKPVSVRSVVTRTVTYKRTTPSLDPAPRGKRRKTESSSGSCLSSNASVSSEDDDTKTKKMPPPPLISIKESSPETATPITPAEAIKAAAAEA